MDRVDPPLVNPERESLLAWLRYHRDTLAMKCEGLDADQLCTRSVPPSSMSLIGLVRHMAEVERNWFRRLINGEGDETADYIWVSEASPDEDFDGVDPASVDDDLAVWRAECAHADEVLVGVGLDEIRTHPFRGEIDVRWVLAHMVEEYARHNGHADLLRECLDGATGD